MLSPESLSYINDQSPVAGQGVMGFYFDNERLADKYGGDTESVDNARATYTNLLNWKGDPCNGQSGNYIGEEGSNVVPALNTNDVLTTFSKDLNATSVDLVATSNYCQEACQEMALGYEDLGEGTTTYECIEGLSRIDVFNETNGPLNFSQDILEEASRIFRW